MNPISLITDSYDRKARVYPSLLLVAPAVGTLVAFLSSQLSALQSLGVAIVGCGGTFLLSQLARDAGKKGEPKLFEQWGGMPSVAIFRHRDGRLDPITKARYQKRLATLARGTKAPTVDEEQADPAAADQVYSAWSKLTTCGSIRETQRNTPSFSKRTSTMDTAGMSGVSVLSASSHVLAALWSLGPVSTSYIKRLERSARRVE